MGLSHGTHAAALWRLTVHYRYASFTEKELVPGQTACLRAQAQYERPGPKPRLSDPESLFHQRIHLLVSPTHSFTHPLQVLATPLLPSLDSGSLEDTAALSPIQTHLPDLYDTQGANILPEIVDQGEHSSAAPGLARDTQKIFNSHINTVFG